MSALRIPTVDIFTPLVEQNVRYKGIHGGRGSGKSHFFAGLCVQRMMQWPGTRIVCVREVQRMLRESVKALIEEKIRQYDVGKSFNILNDRIEGPGRGLILFQGMKEHTKESVKSLEGFDVAYVEEAQTLTDGSLEMLRPTIRKDPTCNKCGRQCRRDDKVCPVCGHDKIRPGSELWFSWNPRHVSDPVDKLLRGDAMPRSALVVQSNYMDNPWLPEVLEEERAHDRKNNPVRYAHIWLGDYEPMAVGAIWNRANLQEHRRAEPPELTRILVGVDPAVSSETASNECGIIVVGMGVDGRGYVLDDVSIVAPPLKWAARVVAAVDRYDADAVVIEVNQGGEMCASTLRTVRPNLRIIQVTATRGKHIRAEPISSLYEMGKISHVGGFPELEGQMVLFTAGGYEGKGSPDRVDALVWGFTEMFPRMVRRGPDPRLPTRANSRYNPHAGLGSAA